MKKSKAIICLMIVVLAMSSCRRQPRPLPVPTPAPSTATATPAVTQIAAEAPALPLPSPSPSRTPTPAPSRTDTPDAKADITKLTALLPSDVGYEWGYSGFGEYAHRMKLKSINKASGQRIYSITGNVLTIPGGDTINTNNTTINLKYIVEGNKIVQDVNSVMMLDADIPEMELIRLPLAKGTYWVQTVHPSKGADVTLQCEIEDVSQMNGKKQYTVTYSDTTGEYQEKRIIEEGVGVIYYEKTFPQGQDLIWMSYILVETNDTRIPQLSPYPTKTPIGQ